LTMMVQHELVKRCWLTEGQSLPPITSGWAPRVGCSPEVGLSNQNNLLGSIFMRKRSLFTDDPRVRLVELFEAGMGATAASNRLNVRYSATEKLYNRWRLHGRLCLMENPTKTAYSFETKKEVVQRYLAGETTMNLAVEFHISSNVL